MNSIRHRGLGSHCRRVVLWGLLLCNLGRPSNLYSAGRTTYQLRLELLPEQHLLRGAMVVTVVNNSPAATNELCFYLAANQFNRYQSPAYQRYQNLMTEISWMKIESLKLNGESQADYNECSPVLRLSLQPMLSPGDSVVVQLTYSVYLPIGRHAFCPTRSDNLYRLINFYPRLLTGPPPEDALTLLKRSPVDYAVYQIACTLPQGYRLFGSLTPDTLQVLDDGRQLVAFQPAYFQEVAFLAHPEFRIARLKSPRLIRLELLSTPNRTTISQTKNFLAITTDILSYYQKFYDTPINPLTIFPTVIRDGYSASNFILLANENFRGVTNLDYYSLYTLARLIAQQYLGFSAEPSDSLLSINAGFANFAAQNYLDARYLYLRQKYKISENIGAQVSRRLTDFLFSSLEKENILQPIAPSTSTNHSFIADQSAYYFSQKYIQLIYTLAGETSFRSILSDYRHYLQEHSPSLTVFNQLVARHTGFDVSKLCRHFIKTKSGPDFAIRRVKTVPVDNQYQVQIVISQQPALRFPLPIRLVSRDGQVLTDTVITKAQRYDTLRYQLSQPIRKVSLDPDRSVWDRQRFNNHYPRNYAFSFVAGLPQVDTYQIFYYPTFDFNRRDWVRGGLKFHCRYWINLQPIFPSQSMDEWSIGINYGYQSHSWGYDFSYSTAVLSPILKPRLYLRWRDYFGLEDGRLSAAVYIGQLRYPGLSRISGFHKLNFGVSYQNVHTTQFLNTNSWETGLIVAPFGEYINYHNWGNWRHILHVQAKFGLPVATESFAFSRYALDAQVKIRLTGRNWYFQRLFWGNTAGKVPRQELFYFFGKNVLENSSFESYRLAHGEGDMRGYGEQQFKGSRILTSNTEWRFALTGKEKASFDLLVFYDAGILPMRFNQLHLSAFKTDAGLGLEADVLEIVRLGLHFPVWVSAPAAGESRWQWRWVVAFDFTL